MVHPEGSLPAEGGPTVDERLNTNNKLRKATKSPDQNRLGSKKLAPKGHTGMVSGDFVILEGSSVKGGDLCPL